MEFQWRNSEKLVEFVWFSLCHHFARRGREGWRELNKIKLILLPLTLHDMAFILMIMIITRLLSGTLFICGPRSIICTLALLGRK